MAIKLPRSLVITFTALAVFIALDLIVLGGLALAYQNKLYPNVQIAGQSLGGLERSEVERRLQNWSAERLSTSVVVSLDVGKEAPIEVTGTAQEFGVRYDTSAAVAEAWNVGHANRLDRWLAGTLKTVFLGTGVPLPYSVDQSAVVAVINTKVTPYVTTPTPAKISIEADKVVVSDAKPGLFIDTEKLTAALVKTLESGLDGETVYVKAETRQTDATLTKAKLNPYAEQLDRLGDTSLLLDMEGTRLRPKRTDLLTWFSVVQSGDGELSVGIEANAVETYLKKNGGNRLDVDASLTLVQDQLARMIADAETATPAGRTLALEVKPSPAVQPGSYTLGRFEGKYIEVNLKEQKLYRINGGALEAVYRVSTGKWSTPTPRGTFNVVSKINRAYSGAYGLYMPYWMNFVGTPDGASEELRTGEYGLHELPEWPNGYKEGQSHLGTAVSHGCVRLGVGDAAELYAWTPVGTPVVIY